MASTRSPSGTWRRRFTTGVWIAVRLRPDSAVGCEVEPFHATKPGEVQDDRVQRREPICSLGGIAQRKFHQKLIGRLVFERSTWRERLRYAKTASRLIILLSPTRPNGSFVNKINIKKIKSDFAARIDAKRSSFDRIVALVNGTPTELTDLNFLCENYLVSVYVEFECLVSDLFHGYINNNNKTYMSHLESKIKNSVKDKYSAWHSSNTSFSAPTHIASAQLAGLLDPTSWNLTFKDVSTMQVRAKEWLTPAHEKSFSGLSASDAALIDAAHAIRNCIAHNSDSSRNEMNTKVRAILTGNGCANEGLEIAANKIISLGKYLRSGMSVGMRVCVYSDRIKAIGSVL